MANHHPADIKEHFDSTVRILNDERLNSFLEKLFQDSSSKYATFSFPIDSLDPLAFLEMRWNDAAYHFYWEKPTDEFAIAAGGELIEISASGPNRFEEINAKSKSIRKQTTEYAGLSHPYAGMMFLGGFSFYDQIEDKRWDALSPASFSVPQWVVVKDGKFNLVTFTVELKDFNAPQDLHKYLDQQLQNIEQTFSASSNPRTKTTGTHAQTGLPQRDSAYDEWKSSVNEAKRLIRQNKFEKIVLARHISVPRGSDISATQVLNNLRRQYTNCYNFLVHRPAGATFLGSTPERLGAFRNRLLLTEALAGSIQRGKTATEDTLLEKHLSGSRKDRNEHNFVIRDIEERLQPFVNKLDRNPQPDIKKLSNVQHLYTPIRAQLKDHADMLEVLGHLHPTPAVGGYPWQNAAGYINELEPFDRGWYAGPVGWLNAAGKGEFAVAIRSGLFTESEAHFFAGCGIVADSDPASEWEETNLKLQPMLSALQYD